MHIAHGGVLCVSAAADLAAGSVEHETEAELHQDDGAEDPGVGGGEAVVLVQRAAAAARRDGGRDEAQHQQQPGHGHQRVVQEVQVLPHGHLGQSEASSGSRDQPPPITAHLQHHARDNQNTAQYLEHTISNFI